MTRDTTTLIKRPDNGLSPRSSCCQEFVVNKDNIVWLGTTPKPSEISCLRCGAKVKEAKA